MAMILGSGVADRSLWSTRGRCSIELAYNMVKPNRTNLLILREAAYGTRRFSDFVERTGMTQTSVAAGLRHLVDVKMLTKEAYRDKGERGREEYALTDKGEDFVVVVLAMLDWGDKYAQPAAPPVKLVADDSDRRVRAKIVDPAGRAVSIDNIRLEGRWQS